METINKSATGDAHRSSTTIPTADPLEQQPPLSLSDSSKSVVGVDDRLFSNTSVKSGPMVLFNDGWRIIFSYLDFLDLVHIRAVSSYFYELTRPESSKISSSYFTCTYRIHRSTSSYKERQLRLSAMLKSPLRVYVTSMIHTDTDVKNNENEEEEEENEEEATEEDMDDEEAGEKALEEAKDDESDFSSEDGLSLVDVMTLRQAHLPRLHTLECSLSLRGPTQTINSDAKSCPQKHQEVRNQFFEQFQFPSTLTSLTISNEMNAETSTIKVVLNCLPLLACTLTQLKLYDLNRNWIEVDFSPLTSLINLHTCAINTTFDHVDGARVKDLMPILVQLPIHHLTYSLETRLDWGLLLPSTPLLTNLQHWSIGPNTSVTTHDWMLLNMHAPNLTSCDCIIRISVEDGYFFQGIHHLEKLKRLAVKQVYDPYQSGLGELTRMPSLEWLRYDTIEQYGALVTKGVLFSLHCLTSLVSLEMARFNLSYLSPDDYQTAFQSLPPHLKITHLTNCELDDLCAGLSSAYRLEVVEISHLRIKSEDLTTVQSKLLAVCQRLPNLQSFVVRVIKGYEGSFQFHSTKEVKLIALTVPAKPLVGIEPNPGPFADNSFAVTSIVTPQTLFKTGLHLIYSYLTTYEWCSSFRTCHGWYQAALTEPCRFVTFDFPTMPIPTKTFPLDHHFTQLLVRNSGGKKATQREFIINAFIVFLPKLSSINWVIQEDIPVMNWPTGLTSLELNFRGLYAPLLLDAIFTLIALKRLSLTGLTTKSYLKLHSLSHLTSLQYLMLNLLGSFRQILPSGVFQALPASLITLDLDSNMGIEKSLGDLPLLPNCTAIDLHQTRLRPDTLSALAKSTPNLKELRPLAFGRPNFRSIALFTHLELLELNEWSSECSNEDLTDLINELKLLSHLTTIVISSEFVLLSSPNVWRELGSSVNYLPHLSTIDCHCSSGELVDVLADYFSNRLTSLTLSTGIERTDHTLPLDALSKMVHLKRLEINHYVNLTRATDWMLNLEVVQPIAIDAHPKSIIDYFGNPLILPQLTYLRVNSRDPTMFMFSWEIGQMTHELVNYRQQMPNSMETSLVTNQSLAETTPPQPRMDTPAERLVGIEPNPGPFESLCSGSPTFSTTTSITAQTIFKEGLHLIYSYLVTNEWCACFRTCHGWQLATAGEPCRQIAYSFPPSNDPGLPHKFGPFPPQRFKYHLTHLKAHRRDHFKIVRLIPNQIITLMNSLPFLRTIELMIPHSSMDLDLHQLEQLCPNLTALSICFMKCAYPKLISHLFSRCTSLTSLALNELSRKQDFTIYTAIASFHQLAHLSIHVVWVSEDVYDDDGGWVGVINDHLSEEVNFLTKAKIEQLPPGITSINLNSSFDSDLLTRLDPVSNVVQYINLSQAELKLGDLKLLHSVAPGLVALQPSRFCLNDFSDLGLFRHLTSISFCNTPLAKHIGDEEMEDMVVDGLLTCSTTLIHLFFRFWHFTQGSAWMRLGEGLPNITWINLDAEFIPEPKLFLEWFPRLTKLTRGQTYNRLIPESSSGGIELKPVKAVPASRLVGIESHPGPVDVTTPPSFIPRLNSAQTLFTDGLNLIFSFLALVD